MALTHDHNSDTTPEVESMSSQEPGTLVTICRKKTQQAAYAGDSLGWARNGPLRTLAVGTLSCHERHLSGSPTHIPPRPPCRKRQTGERQTEGQTGQEPWRSIPAVRTCSTLLPDIQVALRCPARAVSVDSHRADHTQPRC